MDKVTPETLRSLIRESMENTELADQVAASLAPCDGQKITRRLIRAIEKALPDCTVYYRKDPTIYYAVIWGRGHTIQNPFQYLLGYDSSPTYDHTKAVKDYNNCHLGAARERNRLRAELLENSEWLKATAKAINAINEARQSLYDALEYPNPVGCEVEKLLRDPGKGY